MADVKYRAALLSKEEWNYCWVGGNTDYSKLEKAGVLKVKRG